MSTIAKFLPKPPDQFSTQIASSTVSSSALSISLDSTSGLPTEGIGQLFKKDANGNLIAGSVEFCHWTNVSGSTITFSDTGDRGITGSDSGAQSYVADDYFEVWASSYYVGGYGGTVEHNSDGTHTKASAAEIKTGTENAKLLTPLNMRTAGIYTKKIVTIQVFGPTTDTSTGDGKSFFRVPSELNGMNLVAVAASVYTAGTTGTTDIQLRNKTDSVDMLSTKITIDSTETDTSTAAIAAVIDTTKDDVATGDIIAIDVDAVSTTAAKGLVIEMKFELP